MIALERSKGRPLCIGHRGAAALAPENTLESFRVAVEARVELGNRRSGMVEVTTGLPANAVVVTAGHQRLKNGARVDLVNESNNARAKGRGS